MSHPFDDQCVKAHSVRGNFAGDELFSVQIIRCIKGPSRWEGSWEHSTPRRSLPLALILRIHHFNLLQIASSFIKIKFFDWFYDKKLFLFVKKHSASFYYGNLHINQVPMVMVQIRELTYFFLSRFHFGPIFFYSRDSLWFITLYKTLSNLLICLIYQKYLYDLIVPINDFWLKIVI